MYELMSEELWREHRRGLLGEVGGERRGVKSGGWLGARVLGWLRRGVTMLGYSAPEPARGTLGAVERPGEVRCRRERRSRRYCVDSKAALTRFEAAVTNQVALAGGDPAVEAAARALREALRPAVRQLVLELIEQTAMEVDAQLAYQRVEVVLRGGEPALEVRAGDVGEGHPVGEEYGARITLRLPPSLKSAIEEAARSAGESVNAYLVRELSRLGARSGRVGQRMKGTVRT